MNSVIGFACWIWRLGPRYSRLVFSWVGRSAPGFVIDGTYEGTNESEKKAKEASTPTEPESRHSRD